jgi:hypothetical protein
MANAKCNPMTARILILFLVLAGLLPLTAQAQLNYTLATNTDGSIAAYVANNFYASGDIVISNTYEGYPVTSIGEDAFYQGSMTSVTMPNSLINIGDYAFYYCTQLTNVVIPDSVTNIGRQAFYYCTSLTNVIIGTNVATIGHDAFTKCKLTSISFPASVTSISDGVFLYCTNLTSVLIPKNIINIGIGAFSYCNLTNITFLGNAPTIVGGNYVFSGNPATAVYYYYGTSGWGLRFGGLLTAQLGAPPFTYSAVGGTASITGYTGTNGALTIGPIIDGYRITAIGNRAFYKCTNLTSIVISTNVTSIGISAFAYCSNLTSIAISTNATYIGDLAFDYCTSLTSVTIPDSVTYLGYSVFYGCFNLTNAIIGNSVTSIGNAAFYRCTNLTSVIIPASVMYIGRFAFAYCFGLESINIGNGVSNIDSYAFSSCLKLANVIVGNGVTYISNNAFEGAGYNSQLIFTFLGNAPVLGDFAFQNASSADYGPSVRYYYGTSGWSSIYGGLPTVELAWTPQIVGVVKVQADNVGFTVIGTNGMTAVVEASTNLVDWQPVWTNTLSGASATFTDPQWTNYPARYYRAR